MNKSMVYFLTGCVGARLLLAIVAKEIPRKWLPLMGYGALLPAFGFLYLFLSGARKGPGAFGEKIWWEYLRPVHAFLYFAFAFYAINKCPSAWLFLLIDLLVGLVGFFEYHTRKGDFS
jgi:hypothetical protein